MQSPDQPVKASLNITIDLDITDPEAVRSYAVARAQTAEHIAMASANLFGALAISVDPLRIADEVPGVRLLRGKVEPAEGHATADLALPDTGGEATGREPAATGIGEDPVAALVEASARVRGLSLELLGYDGSAPEAEREL